MNKVALFVFNGDPMCFIHVLLNALDLYDKGENAVIVIEGAAVKLVPTLADPASPLYGLWQKCLAHNLVAGVCKACAAKLGTLAAAEEQELPLLAAMSGHPSMAAFMEKGYAIITF